jgi:hypothetical protein
MTLKFTFSRARSASSSSTGTKRSGRPATTRRRVGSARVLLVLVAVATSVAATAAIAPGSLGTRTAHASEQHPNQVLDWNQLFIDTLIATNTPNSSSQRLGAIVHTAIFDAYNGLERRYTPLFAQNADASGHRLPPPGASRRAAVVAAAYTALVSLFPTRAQQLSGIAWGEHVAQAVLAWRVADGFSAVRPPFNGGTAIGQWRPIPPATTMTGYGLAFTAPFVVESAMQFRPAVPRPLASGTYMADFAAVKALGRKTGSTRTEAQTALAPFWEGNASVHWNQAANQMARANHLSMSAANRLFALLNVAMADTAFTVWSAKRHYGEDPAQVTWRPLTAITLADTDGIEGTTADSAWTPLVTSPSHPEYPAGHPAQNGAAATILANHFGDGQAFTLTTPGQADQTYTGIWDARADGNNARIWGGMHYPSTVAVSDAVGEAIARYVDANSMQSLRDHE